MTRTTDNTSPRHSRTGISHQQLQQAITEGIQLYGKGKLAEAGRLAQRILIHDQKNADAWHLLGVVATDLGEHQKGMELVGRAIALRPSSGAYHNSMGNVCSQMGDFTEAADSYRKAIRLDPRIGNAILNLGRALFAMGNTNEAVSCLRRATTKSPQDPMTHYELARALWSAARDEEAKQALDTALKLKPNFAEAHNYLAIVLQHQGCFEQALRHFEQALKYLPEEADIHANYGQLLLRLDRPDPGWQEYDWRHKGEREPEMGSSVTPFAEKKLFLYGEQGVGDELMFASCLPRVLEQAAGVELNCDSRLVPLFRRSFPGLDVHAGVRNTKGQWEYQPRNGEIHMMSGSLPRYLHQQPPQSLSDNGYLQPSEEALEQWRLRYASLGTALRIGISWRGGGNEQSRRERSTSLEQWAPILSVPGVCAVNLQYGDCSDEIESLEAKHGIHINHWPDSDPLTDLDNFAAQVAALDLIISVDNTTVHMAGALGRPTWTLLPAVADWRWMVAREDSPWYSSMHLYRQTKYGDWTTIIERIAHHLSRLVQQQTTD